MEEGHSSSHSFPGNPSSFAHLLSRELLLFVFREVLFRYSEHLAHIRLDICSVVAVAFEQIALEFVLGFDVSAEISDIEFLEYEIVARRKGEVLCR
jgi:hypothetical protein